MLSKWYSNVYRQFRKIYKWSPDVSDNIPLRRITKIFDEMLEDQPDPKKGGISEDDFE